MEQVFLKKIPRMAHHLLNHLAKSGNEKITNAKGI
jgi:hypothetical protein